MIVCEVAYLEIIGKFADVLKVDPAEFFLAPSGMHRKS